MTKDKMKQVCSKYLAYLLGYNGYYQIEPKELPKELYDKTAKNVSEYVLLCHLAWMCQRCLNCLIDHEPLKAHVWIGYIQGELRAADHFSITDMRDHNREPKVEVGPYGKVPRRFRIKIKEGEKHPNGAEHGWYFGCYFPQTDLVVYEMGQRGTGMPKDVEWLDEPSNG